ncbi:unnamed protein product [Angiostrongylus costaricensis]|uniref:Lipoprotein n=1 Tax=Angiostrongylus costaricensis TaxID=334426 RepID=A0A0R3PKV7_ANGCS|nr:unnamed protein product [Angiostrongylus costaricensis]
MFAVIIISDGHLAGLIFHFGNRHMRDSTSTNTTSVKTKPAEDTWTSQRINTKPIQDAVRVFGQTNMYVALWSQQGKPPVVGQAWNDGGALQCAFACDQKVFTGANIGTETIQLLKYEGDHATNQFYYEWIPLSEWKSASKTETTREMVRSGPVSPIYWKEKCILGSYDVAAQKADFAQAENFIKVSEAPTLGSMLVLVRNTGGGPAGCTCTKCAAKDLKQAKQLIVNDWGDFYVGNQWPVDKPIVKALNRPLRTPRGPEDHFVALWYHHGKPCMGRAWNHAGKIDVSFVE